MVLEFDPLLHEYRENGQRLLYITQILRATRIMELDPHIPPLVLERARDRGSKTHLCIRYANEGRLDATSLDAAIEPYLFAWEAFCSEHMADFTPLVVEEPMADRALGFAGTPDAIGLLKGTLAVVEVKTCAIMPPGAAVQTAAQKLLARANGHAVVRRFGVQLKPDGTFRLHEYRDPLDQQEFLAALTICARRLARGERIDPQ